MNDFTKKELQKIQSSLISMGAIEHDLDFNLADKIQFLIDNYCEHEMDIDKEIEQNLAHAILNQQSDELKEIE